MGVKNFYNGYWSRHSVNEMSWRHKKGFDFVEAKSKVLDVGCGDGMLMKSLYKIKNCDVTGLDVSKIALNRLEKFKSPKFRTYLLDIEQDWYVEENGFDVVVALDVIEHLFNPRAFLERMNKTTNKHIIISYANTVYLKNRLDILFGKVPTNHPFRNGQHLHYWSFNGFIDLIEEFFDIVDIKCLGHLPPFSKFMPFTMREFLGKRLFPNLLSNGVVVLARKQGLKK